MKLYFDQKNDYLGLNNRNAIQTFSLTKNFKNRTAVNSINLTIKKGEIFALLGPNGAGKTTTIKMLCCLLKPTAGKAVIMGYDIEKEQSTIKQIINISPQETAVANNLTVLENLILMGGVYGIKKQEAKMKAQELIKLIDLSDRTKELAKKLSGGMQCRLSLAMALITNPQVLFLDEPTLGWILRQERQYGIKSKNSRVKQQYSLLPIIWKKQKCWLIMLPLFNRGILLLKVLLPL